MKNRTVSKSAMDVVSKGNKLLKHGTKSCKGKLSATNKDRELLASENDQPSQSNLSWDDKELIESVMSLLDEGAVIPHEFVVEVLKRAIRLHSLLPNVVQVSRGQISEAEDTNEPASRRSVRLNDKHKGGNLTVVGDLHGQYRDFANIIRDSTIGGFPSDSNRFIFNGDIVDRGDNSVGIMVTVLLMKLFHSEAVHMLRGNHEDSYLCENFGFFKEIREKYPQPDKSKELEKLFVQLFRVLPLCAVIEKEIFVTHGGIGEHTSLMTITQLNALHRFRGSVEPEEAIYELLWRDPKDTPGLGSDHPFLYIMTGRRPGFGPDVTKAFLARNNLKWMIRSHQHCDIGFMKHHEDLCWTVFSAPNYCGSTGNKGSVIRFVDPFSMEPTLVPMHALHYPLPLQPPPPLPSSSTATAGAAPTTAAGGAGGGGAAAVDNVVADTVTTTDEFGLLRDV